MVEGGGTVHTQFLTEGLVDELHLVVAPFFVGDSRARRFVGDGGSPGAPTTARRLVEARPIGDVVLLRYALSDRFETSSRSPMSARCCPTCPSPGSATRSRCRSGRADGFATVATAYTFDRLVDCREHLALQLGEPRDAVPLVRLHSECLTGDVLGSQRCDCGPQLREALERLTAVGGYLLYLRQEGRGIGLYNKLDAYSLQDTGLDTYQANVALGHGPDERDYAVAAQMLLALGIDELSLLSNNPDKAEQLEAAGLTIVSACPLPSTCRRRTPTTWPPRRGTARTTSRWASGPAPSAR